ncbi:4-phosphoerythronate dehydrogenase [Acinetobacter puyangensis]|uniref:Erythronate-4-phosphate dehydrogenase n=1 Tax=Acinetobacter puyangensis TaxID=1096779 RepID=A0A240E796_9GAMM|nr:4-phosphoerythronate dehydrogenase [Acinetobacter puyangensis]SNX43765.1 erythronate-4-phosphate dehydrogenase [Acinetobacter puyangensis]
MNIVADENLAFTDYFFADFGTIRQHAGRTLQQQDLVDCDALLVRSVTQVNATLIHDTPIQFVGSATIGTDHLDIAELDQRQIHWANAPGCNAQAVAEYVVTALLTLKPELIEAGQSFCLGIVGLGNVGTRLAALAQHIGWRVIGSDPFTQHQQIEQVDFQTLLQTSHAISIHVPLTKTGEHATQHLFDAQTLQQLPPDTILINSARGPVIAEDALIADIEQTGRQVVLDVFEHEPMISEKLLSLLSLATPHIAGYSLEGKARGTQMIYQAFCQTFGFDAHKRFENQLEACPQIFQGQDFKNILMQHLQSLYDIRQDDANVRACLNNGFVDQKAFDLLRKTYPLRREWSAFGA